MESVTVKELLKDGNRLTQHNVGSVFVHKETGHLLITNIHAATHDVSKDGCHRKWCRLYFHHKRVTSTERRYYTELDFTGTKPLTAAPMSPHTMPQLIPSVYNDARSGKVNAGLIGKLPLLIAIAAFSAPKDSLENVLTTRIRPRQWRSHMYESGRSKLRSPPLRFSTNVVDEEYRGMIVSICYDPSNSKGSTSKSLDALQDGDLGPFYD